jgi:hypothetical protein
MEGTLCKSECRRLENAKDRRNLALFQVQKNFLITQFLEKGLNPCIAPNRRPSTKTPRTQRSQTTLLEETRSGERKLESKLSDARSKRSVKFKQSNDTVNSDHWDFSTFPNKGKLPGLSLDRSKTLMNIPLRKKAEDGLPKLDIEKLSEEDEEDSEKGCKSTKGRRSLEYLKSHPDELFPRLKVLLKMGTAGPPSPVAEISVRDKQLESAVRARKDEETQEEYYIKMLQRITAYLPNHLIKTAKSQVREMANGDAITQLKSKLLETSKEQMERDILLSDDRWKILEEKLSSTHQPKWKKSHYTNQWVFEK